MNNLKSVLVCGASTGIGFEMIKNLCSKGHKVYAVSRTVDSLKVLKAENPNYDINVASLDLSGEVSKDLQEFLAEEQLDHVIYNAGMLINKPFLSIDIDEFRSMYEVNVLGLIKVLKIVMKNLSSQFASVTTISSMGGVNGTSKFPGLSGYSSSKGALSVLTECLAEEYKEENIHFNSLALGAVQTEMLEKAFPGYEADISPIRMSEYIINFVLKNSDMYNGKVLPVSMSTP